MENDFVKQHADEIQVALEKFSEFQSYTSSADLKEVCYKAMRECLEIYDWLIKHNNGANVPDGSMAEALWYLCFFVEQGDLLIDL